MFVISQRPEFRGHAPRGTSQPEAHWEGARPAPEVVRVVEALTELMAAAGYAEKHIFGMRLALEEAIQNAVKHGHRGDALRAVRITWHLNGERVVAEVEDQGAGFDPEEVPDPRAPENLERTCGRGLFLMRHYMTWVRCNARGNRVTLCRERSAG
jgi:serine/threonine-protein kinase RsbW